MHISDFSTRLRSHYRNPPLCWMDHWGGERAVEDQTVELQTLPFEPINSEGCITLKDNYLEHSFSAIDGGWRQGIDSVQAIPAFENELRLDFVRPQ